MSRIAKPVSLALVAALAFAPVLGVAAAQAALPTSLAADGDITWSVEPIKTSEGVRRSFEYSVDPGTQISDSIVVTNAGDKSADFVIYATDAVNILDTGAFSLLKRDETPTDVGSWVTAATDAITIDPGMQAIVPFTLLVPSDATPGEHVAGIVASVISVGDDDGAAVELEQRVGARIYLSVSGPLHSGVELEGVTSSFSPQINPFAPGDMHLEYTVHNTGNIREDVTQSITVSGPFGIQLATLTPDAMTELLPGQRIRTSVTVPAIAALLLAFTGVTVTPVEVGTAAAVADSESATPAPTAQPTETAEPTVADLGVDYLPVSETSFSFAFSWSMFLLILIAFVLVYIVWRYITGTRESMYLAIDEAAEAARAEALAQNTGGTRAES